LLKNLSEIEDTNHEISIKKLLTELSSFENKNVIVDFEDFTVNFNNFDLVFDDMISFLTSKGIFYKKIGENTYSFFENKKILKYKLTIIAGDNIETNSVKDLYEILNGNISVMSNLKNSLNNTYIVTKPEIYVQEGDFGELNSVLTIPIFEEKDGKSQVVDTIESGVKLKIKGNYNRDTDIIDTQIELLLSEFSEETQKEESGYSMNQRSLITKLKMKNGSTIKAGNMNFSKIIEKSDGLSIFKNIPVFGKLFYNEESSIRNYNIIIFLNIEIDSKAEDISL
jgi:type II secretory pathway component GspD/PulD (secretin)